MIIINLGYEICDVRCAFCNLEGYDRFVITSCRTRTKMSNDFLFLVDLLYSLNLRLRNSCALLFTLSFRTFLGASKYY